MLSDAREKERLPRVKALTSETVRDELLLFPQGEDDDLFDGLQTMVEGAKGCAMVQAFRYPPFARW